MQQFDEMDESHVTASKTNSHHNESEMMDSQSPQYYSRIHEKQDLANLNNRLACYIDRVRLLESENNRLHAEVKSSQDILNREIDSLKTMYESELNDTRKNLDQLAIEKAKLQIDSQRLFAEKMELKIEFNIKIEELAKVQEELSLNEKRLSVLNHKCKNLDSENKKLFESNDTLTKINEKLLGDLENTKKALDEEILERVNSENTLLSLKEEYTFNLNLLEKQLSDTKKNIEVDRHAIDGELNREYEEQFSSTLLELRNQYENDLENNKNEMRKMYENKIKNLETQLTRSNDTVYLVMEDTRNLQAKIEKLNGTIQNLEIERNNALDNAREVEKKLDQMKSDFIKDYAYHEAEMSKLREEMAKQSKDYEELMDVKVALDMEISAFRKLLECEEQRLNITPAGSPRQHSFRKILKGKRRHEESFDSHSNITLNSTLSSQISISAVSTDGKFIKITNNSSESIKLSGWELTQSVDKSKTSHVFKRKATLKSGSTLVVWSADEPDIPKGAENMVGSTNWMPSEQMTITLFNSDGQEMASAELKVGKRPLMSDSLSSNQTLSEEKCSIM